MAEEFADRFGPLPEEVRNLFLQLTVKIKAEAAGLATIGIEADQLVLRYPPLPDGQSSRNLSNLGVMARAGKNAYWLPYTAQIDTWQQRLLDVLDELRKTPVVG
jgi:transcription-repair coupling factor (superfamily II helicase)